MRCRRFSGSVARLGILALSLAVLAGVARAEIPKKVQAKFRGEILITSEELPEDAGDLPSTVKLYRQKKQGAVEHFTAEGVAAWDFHFLAFMRKPPRASQVSLDFYTRGKEKLFVANKRFTGVDPKLKLLKGHIQITENDGLKRGTTYDVKLSAQVRGREVILATTRLTAK